MSKPKQKICPHQQITASDTSARRTLHARSQIRAPKEERNVTHRLLLRAARVGAVMVFWPKMPQMGVGRSVALYSSVLAREDRGVNEINWGPNRQLDTSVLRLSSSEVQQTLDPPLTKRRSNAFIYPQCLFHHKFVYHHNDGSNQRGCISKDILNSTRIELFFFISFVPITALDELTLGVPLCCPAALPILPDLHLHNGTVD